MRVYADTAFFVALIVKTDDLRASAMPYSRATPDLSILTSDAVFVEFLAHVSAMGMHLRRDAVDLIDSIRSDPGTTIIRQTPELFDAGFELYRERPDKGYSLTDCMSMVICGEQDIKQVLTHDRHFAQEGFEILL